MELIEGIFEKIEAYQHAIETPRRCPPVTEFWKQITPDLYQCQITGRKLSKSAFRRYQEQSGCGPMGFVVEVI